MLRTTAGTTLCSESKLHKEDSVKRSFKPASFNMVGAKSLKHSLPVSVTLWAPDHFTIHTRWIGVPAAGVFGLVVNHQMSDRCASWLYGVRMRYDTV